jgi:DNA-binding GntR family transcriptional regulator
MLNASVQETDGSSDLTARLREAITSGRFMPNERLIETDLARVFDANRSNVRIALAMLDQEGLVVRERNRGARVRLVSDREAIEIAEARQAIEAMVARQAAERANDKDRASLRAVMAQMRAAFEAQDFILFSQLNAELHRDIQNVAANATASRLLQTLKSQVVRLQYRAILLPGRPAKSLAEHVEIVDAICANDAASAELSMRRHLSEVKDALRQAIQAARLESY